MVRLYTHSWPPARARAHGSSRPHHPSCMGVTQGDTHAPRWVRSRPPRPCWAESASCLGCMRGAACGRRSLPGAACHPRRAARRGAGQRHERRRTELQQPASGSAHLPAQSAYRSSIALRAARGLVSDLSGADSPAGRYVAASRCPGGKSCTERTACSQPRRTRDGDSASSPGRRSRRCDGCTAFTAACPHHE